MRVVATAVYVTGTARLEPGRRYGIAIRETQLLILGPTDLNSRNVALERPARAIQVSALEGRLILSEPSSGSGLVLAFMSVAGAPLNELADTIRAAANGTPT